MRLFLMCALFPLMVMATPAAAQEEAQGDATPEETAPQDTAQNDEEILETVPVDEGGTESEPPPEDDDTAVSYSGIGLSRVSTDFDNLDEAINLDFVLGIRVPTINWISAEINFATTIIPGENKGQPSGGGFGGGGDPCIFPGFPPGCVEGGGGGSGSSSQGKNTRSRNDLQMNNIGVFAVLRSPGKFYGLGKVGYRYVNTSIEEIQEGGDKGGTAYGLGGGYRWGKGLSGVELLYVDYSKDLEYIGFNIAYGFGGLR